MTVHFTIPLAVFAGLGCALVGIAWIWIAGAHKARMDRKP